MGLGVRAELSNMAAGRREDGRRREPDDPRGKVSPELPRIGRLEGRVEGRLDWRLEGRALGRLPIEGREGRVSRAMVERALLRRAKEGEGVLKPCRRPGVFFRGLGGVVRMCREGVRKGEERRAFFLLDMMMGEVGGEIRGVVTLEGVVMCTVALEGV